MDVSSFYASVMTSFVIFFVLMVLFSWMSRKPGNEVIYFPNRILRGLDPWEGRRRTRNPFAWIKEAVGATDADVIAAAGVDTAVYLLFLFSVLQIFVFSGIFLLPALLPIAQTDRGLEIDYQKNHTLTYTDLDKLGMSNIESRSPRLWACLLGTYWVSFVTFCVLWRAYRYALDLRVAAKKCPEVKPEDFAILVLDIPTPPKDQGRKEQVDTYFRALHPDTFYKSMVMTDNKKANKIWEKLEGYRKKLARAEYVFSESKTTSKPEGTKPTNRTGFLGLIGAKVDTIDYCNEKIKELLPELEAEQKTTLNEKQLSSALVFFNSKTAAVSASQTLHAEMADTWTVMEAPEPRQIIWTNLKKKFYERLIRQYTVYGIVFLTVVFYMIPITFISAITTLQNLRKLLPFLEGIVDLRKVRTILEAYLPQIALMVFLALLPSFLMKLSKAEGIPDRSHANRAASGKYFYFVVFNVFLGVTLVGTLLTSLKDIINQPSQIVTMLAQSLPKNATFFLTYVALKFFVGYGLELSRLVPLIIFNLKKKFLCKTESEVKEAWAPGELNFATRVPNDMLIVTIVLCYSVIAPLIIPFGVTYFALGWIVARNQALKVYVPSYESYGRMWPHMHARIVAALIVYQITMFGYIGLKEFPYAALVVPLIGSSFIFAFTCKKRFYLSFACTSLEVACKGTKEVPDMEFIFTSFIPACLRGAEKSGDNNIDTFEGLPSHMSGRLLPSDVNVPFQPFQP